MASKLTDTERAAIIADIQTGELSRNEIAKKHKRGAATITDIAQKAGLTTAFDRSETKNATEAALADARARRALLSAKFLTKADQLLDRIDGQYLVHSFGGRDNDYNDQLLDVPPAGEIRNLMISAATAFDKHLAADKHDTDSGADAARSMLGQLAAGLGAAYEQLMQEDTTPSDDGG